jgi:cyanophycin synthetase
MRAAERAIRLCGQLSQLRYDRPEIERSGLYRSGWIDAAARLSWPVDEIGAGFIRIHTPRRTVLVRGAHVGVDDVATYLLAGDKAVSSRLLQSAGLPLPVGRTYGSGSSELYRLLRKRGHELVVKPAADSGGGRGITVGPLRTSLAVRAVIDAAAFGKNVICEEMLTGRVLRILVQDGEVLDAVERSPARVHGDGESSVDDLVARENARRVALGDRATGFISTGPDYRAALARAGLKGNARPGAGVEVAVSGRSNSGSERESRRVSPPAGVLDAARTAASAVGIYLAGVDVLVDDSGRLVALLEVNTAPGLHWHQLVATEPYDVFSAVLTRLDGGPRSRATS